MKVNSRKALSKLSFRSLRASKKQNIIAVLAIILTTVLFTKLLSIVYLPRKHNLPITIFFRLQDSIRMIAIIAAAFTVCFFIMRRLIRNMNITTALKMGED